MLTSGCILLPSGNAGGGLVMGGRSAAWWSARERNALDGGRGGNRADRAEVRFWGGGVLAASVGSSALTVRAEAAAVPQRF